MIVNTTLLIGSNVHYIYEKRQFTMHKTPTVLFFNYLFLTISINAFI